MENSNIKLKSIGDYLIGKTIGQGAFSKVKLGSHKETGQKVAIKIIDKKLMAKNSTKKPQNATIANVIPSPELPSTDLPPAEFSSKENIDFLSKLDLEVQLMLRLNHPNIIKVYQVIDSADECYIIMDYARGGELIEYIASRDCLSEKESRRLFRQIISAMDHCHLANVVHRDLKLENLLLNGNKDILLSDFGLGRTFDDNTNQYMDTFCGTPNYAAVELVSGIPYVGVKSDMWAMGVVLYFMVAGQPPFQGETISHLYKEIKAVHYKVFDTFSKELRHLLSRMLCKDPQKRIDIEELRGHPWVIKDINIPPDRIFPPLKGNADPMKLNKLLKQVLHEEKKSIWSISHEEYNSLPFEKLPSNDEKKEKKPELMPSFFKALGSRSRRTSDESDVNNQKEPEFKPTETIPLSDPEIKSTVENLKKESIEIPPVIMTVAMQRRLRRHSAMDQNKPFMSPTPAVRERRASNISKMRHTDGPNPIDNSKEGIARSGFLLMPAISAILKKSASSIFGAIKAPDNNVKNDSNAETLKTDIISPLGGHVRRISFSPTRASPSSKENNTLESPQENPLTLSMRKRYNTENTPNPQEMLSPVLATRKSFIRSASYATTRAESSLRNPILEVDAQKLERSGSNVIMVSGFDSQFEVESSVSYFSNHEVDREYAATRDAQELLEWSTAPKTIRTMQLGFKLAKSSILEPSDIFRSLLMALQKLKKMHEGKFKYKKHKDLYMLTCNLVDNFSADSNEIIRFEVEICKVWLLKMHGIRIRRVSGDSYKFKEFFTFIKENAGL